MFGRPIGQNQGIAFPLAEAHMQLHAAELVIREASWRYDNGLPCGEQANMAKYLAADAGFKAADQAMQTLGGMGYATRVRRRALLARGPPDAHRPDQPGDGLQLRPRTARARPAPVVLINAANRTMTNLHIDQYQHIAVAPDRRSARRRDRRRRPRPRPRPGRHRR